MCHDFGKGTTYFQRYLENDFNGIEKDHGPISAMFTYWMLPDKWKHLGFLIVKKHHGDINNASDECRIDEVSWDFKKQIKDILDNNSNIYLLLYSLQQVHTSACSHKKHLLLLP